MISFKLNINSECVDLCIYDRSATICCIFAQLRWKSSLFSSKKCALRTNKKVSTANLVIMVSDQNLISLFNEAVKYEGAVSLL